MSGVDERPPGIDPDAVGRWLATHIEDARGPFTFAVVHGGRSNLTFRVTDAAGRALALRRPPVGGVLHTAHDMGREWRFLTALMETAVRVPRPLGFCEDPAVTGAEFYVMEFVDGVVLGDEGSASGLDHPARRRVGEELVDTLAALHRLDPRDVGLADAGRPDGYVDRQLRRWRRQAHESGSASLAALDEAHDLLASGVPPQHTAVVHGDFRPGNAMFAADGRLLAVLDWELATLGDPLADLGWLVSSWAGPGDEVLPTTRGPSALPGFAARSELVDRYAAASGRDVGDLPYYVAFAYWRSACIYAGVLARHRAGFVPDDGTVTEVTEERVARLAEASLTSGRDLGLSG